MIVARIRTIKNRTEDTTMREEVNEDSISELIVLVPGGSDTTMREEELMKIQFQNYS